MSNQMNALSVFPYVPPGRKAVTLVEVMLAVTVLVVGIGAMTGQIASLASMRQSNFVDQEAQALISNLSERFSSANIAQLRTSALPWSYARPLPDNGANTWPGGSTWAAPEVAWVRPMNISMDPAKVDSADGNNLVKLGLANSDKKLVNPQVFVEYYRALTWFDTGSTFNPTTLDTTLNPLVYNNRNRWPGVMRDVNNLGADGQGLPMYGLMCEANPFKPVTVADFSAIMGNAAKRKIYYLNTLPSVAITGSDLAGIDHSFDSVLVRLTVTWGSKNMLDMSSPTSVAATRDDWLQGRRLEFWTGLR